MSDKRAILALLALAAAAVALCLVCTPWGIGVSADSASYIIVARHALEGRGLSLWDSGQMLPMTLWPPLFPAALAAPGLFGVDPWPAARWLNAALFGANVLLASWLIRLCSGSSRSAIAGAFLALTSITILHLHAMAWTEPLFLFCGFLGLGLLSACLDRGRPWVLLASAALAALAFLTRYAGVVYAGAGFWAIVFFSRRKRARRALDAAVYAVVGFSPMGAWMIRNKLQTGSATQRRVEFHFDLWEQARKVISAVTSWLFPANLFHLRLRCVLFLAAMIGLLAACVWLWRKGRAMGRPWNPAWPAEGRGRELAKILALFMVLYVAFIGLAIAFMDANTDFDSRILSPVYFAALVLAVSFAARSGPLLEGAPRLRRVAAFCAVGLGAIYCVSAARYVVDSRGDGRAFASRAWLDSALVRWIGRQDAKTPVYSNVPDAIDFITGRDSNSIPAKIDPVRARQNPDYAAQMAALGRDLRRGEAFLVYFNTATEWRWFLPSEDEVREQLGLRPVFQAEDGTVYTGGGTD